jgi:hypothetical protein
MLTGRSGIVTVIVIVTVDDRRSDQEQRSMYHGSSDAGRLRRSGVG